MTRILPAFAVALILAAPAVADAPARTHDVTVEDYFTLAAVTDVAMSPDGKLVAYAEGRWQKSTNDRKTDLWLIVVDPKGEVKRLTADRANDRSLKWGPDSKTLYFLGNRKREGERQPPYDGKTQVWKASADGSEPVAVTRVEGGVDAFDLTADGTSLFYTVTTSATDADDFSGLRSRFDLEHGHGRRQVSQVWRLDLKTWRAEKVIDEKRYVREFGVTRDGKKLAMITTPDDTVVTFEGRSTVDVWDAASGKVVRLDDRLWRKDAPSPYAWLETLAWSPDGKRLAFNSVFDAYPAEVIVADLAGDRPPPFRRVRGQDEVRGYGTPLRWRNNDDLCYLQEEAARVRLVGTLSGNWGFKDEVVSAFSFSDGERAVALVGDAAHFPELYLIGERFAKLQRLTDLNPQTATWKLPKVEHVTWAGADGTEVGGVLELPPDYEKGKRVPLVVGIHGGPTTATYADLEFNFYEGRLIFPARGYAVLCPNYRGSTGYGDKFITDLIGHENGIEVEDILKGVDALVERGVADPERLGVMGWSNGGYLTNCCITKTTRFKAASSGAGILDCVIEWGTNDEPAYPTVFKTGFPWEKPDVYRRTSPGYDLGKVRTPTLIHVGANDERCPPGHSRMLYRALHEYLKVPTELCVYPGEPHGLAKYEHRQAKMEWDLAWFDRYVLRKK